MGALPQPQSGTGTAGITRQDHIGRFEPDPARQDEDTGAALAGLAAVADKLAGVRACAGRAGPTVVT